MEAFKLLNLPVTVPEEIITAFSERHQIKKLALFGSVLRNDFGSESDVDVLVEYLPESLVTYFDMVQQEAELSELFGRQVDLRTPMELSRHFRKKVVETAQVIYERAG